MMWIEIFKNENPTLKAFQDFKSFVKSKSRSRIRILIFNNKGEFNFEKFNKFYNQKGIRKELMQPYSP
jgi:ATP-dependent exoDNAse (exonuclease V) alpha subunit